MIATTYDRYAATLTCGNGHRWSGAGFIVRGVRYDTPRSCPRCCEPALSEQRVNTVAFVPETE
jgi:hypothetical protein